MSLVTFGFRREDRTVVAARFRAPGPGQACKWHRSKHIRCPTNCPNRIDPTEIDMGVETKRDLTRPRPLEMNFIRPRTEEVRSSYAVVEELPEPALTISEKKQIIGEQNTLFDNLVKKAARFNATTLATRASTIPIYFDSSSNTWQVNRSIAFNSWAPVSQELNIHYIRSVSTLGQTNPLMPPPSIPHRLPPVATPTHTVTAAPTATPLNAPTRSLEATSRPTIRKAGPTLCDWCDRSIDQDDLELGGEGSRVFRCATCNKYYHEQCLQVSGVTANKIWEHKDEWQCMDCKTCSVCSSPGSEEKLLICDDCDRGFHTYCLKPALPRLPPGSWRCDDCVHCESCGAETPGTSASSRWRKDYTMCESCWSLFKKARFCPICEKVYKPHDTTPMIECDLCEKWLHVKCDKSLNKQIFESYAEDESLKYWCPDCKAKNGQLLVEAEPDPPSEAEGDFGPPLVLDRAWLLERLATDTTPTEQPSKKQKVDAPARCFFCQEGDGQPVQGLLEAVEGFKQIFVHKNCIEWAARLPTETDGDVIHRTRKGKLLCGRKGCGIRGASVGCFNAHCPKSYHFKCALMVEGVFTGHPRKFEFYCPQHQ